MLQYVRAYLSFLVQLFYFLCLPCCSDHISADLESAGAVCFVKDLGSRNKVSILLLHCFAASLGARRHSQFVCYFEVDFSCVPFCRPCWGERVGSLFCSPKETDTPFCKEISSDSERWKPPSATARHFARYLSWPLLQGAIEHTLSAVLCSRQQPVLHTAGLQNRHMHTKHARHRSSQHATSGSVTTEASCCRPKQLEVFRQAPIKATAGMQQRVNNMFRGHRRLTWQLLRLHLYLQHSQTMI